MAFRGWPVEALEFYEGLEADNSKTYWQANKAVYEQHVLAPMEALLAELETEFGRGKIFRPYRDVRFSKDKSPYKTAIGATLSGGGYVHLSAEGLGTGSGMYHMAPDQVTRFRDRVAADSTGVPIGELVEAARARGIDVTAHDVLKTVPKGFPKDHPRADLLRLKGLVTWRQWPAGAWLGTAKAKTRIVEFLREVQPINDWLDANVGPSDAPPDRRS
jgi:uncharacterized protein (TIGR02453 family)